MVGWQCEKTSSSFKQTGSFWWISWICCLEIANVHEQVLGSCSKGRFFIFIVKNGWNSFLFRPSRIWRSTSLNSWFGMLSCFALLCWSWDWLKKSQMKNSDLNFNELCHYVSLLCKKFCIELALEVLKSKGLISHFLYSNKKGFLIHSSWL